MMATHLQCLTGMLALAACACSGISAPHAPIDLGVPPVTRMDPQARRVLVVVNSASAEGVAIARYYRLARGIPDSNEVMITTTLDDDVNDADFASQIQGPVLARL